MYDWGLVRDRERQKRDRDGERRREAKRVCVSSVYFKGHRGPAPPLGGVCVSSVYFEGHRGPAPPLGGANQRAPKGRPTRTPPRNPRPRIPVC